MSSRQPLPIAIYYEQPIWFKLLFEELDRRGANYVKLNAVEHSYGPEDHPEEKYAVVLNKMSPSAWNRGHGDQIFYTLGFPGASGEPWGSGGEWRQGFSE